MPQEGPQIRSEAVQDILTRVPHWMILWGNTIVLILLILFFLLSWFIKYPDIITAETLVTSDSPPQKEYAPSSGKIDTILVKDNDHVSTNEILVVTKNTAKLEHVLLLKLAMDTVQIQSGHLSFPIDKIPLLSLGEIAPAYALFEKDYIDYSLNNSLDPFSNQIAANNFSENELQLRLENLKTQQTIDKKKFELAQNEYNRNKTLHEKGVISLNEFEAKELQFLENEKRLKNGDIAFSQLKQSINNAYRNSKETKINYQMESTRLFKNVVQSFTQLREAIKAWELKHVLKSQTNGTVSFVNIWNQGQTVQAGDLLLTVIPNDASYYNAKVKAPVQNSGKIKQGQKVNIKLFNYPETEYGMLSGFIKSMSAIPNEEGFYLVNVELPEGLTTSFGIEIPFKNEMSGSAEIITEDLRLLERFFYQLRGIFN